jgi:hypothetical protein
MEKLHKNDEGKPMAQDYGSHEEFLTEDELAQMDGPEPDYDLPQPRPSAARRRGKEVVKGRNSFQDYKDRAKDSTWS